MMIRDEQELHVLVVGGQRPWRFLSVSDLAKEYIVPVFLSLSGDL